MDDQIPATKFQIYSGILKASRSADGKMRLHGVASSTTKDLHGDVMAETALEDMERAANNNLTIFLNHSYDVPEDVGGSVENARMKTRGVDGNGNPNKDLDMDILINESNDRAVKTFEAIERGTKLGLSIGALIPDGGAKKDKSSGSWIIEHVDLLETSLVGIPANPRSWVDYAVKSLRSVEKDAASVPIGQPTLTLDGRHYKIEGDVEGLSLNSTTTIVNGVVPETVEATEPDLTEAACPTCGKSKSEGGDCGDAYHTKEIDPDVTDSKITLIEIDTDDGSSSSDSDSDGDASQEADSDPDSGDYAASVEDNLAVALQLQKAVSELVELKQSVADLTKSRDDAIAERDAAQAATKQVATDTQRVLNTLADTPLVRRAVVVEAQQALNDRFRAVYSDEFLKILGVPKNG